MGVALPHRHEAARSKGDEKRENPGGRCNPWRIAPIISPMGERIGIGHLHAGGAAPGAEHNVGRLDQIIERKQLNAALSAHLRGSGVGADRARRMELRHIARTPGPYVKANLSATQSILASARPCSAAVGSAVSIGRAPRFGQSSRASRTALRPGSREKNTKRLARVRGWWHVPARSWPRRRSPNRLPAVRTWSRPNRRNGSPRRLLVSASATSCGRAISPMAQGSDTAPGGGAAGREADSRALAIHATDTARHGGAGQGDQGHRIGRSDGRRSLLLELGLLALTRSPGAGALQYHLAAETIKPGGASTGRGRDIACWLDEPALLDQPPEILLVQKRAGDRLDGSVANRRV